MKNIGHPYLQLLTNLYFAALLKLNAVDEYQHVKLNIFKMQCIGNLPQLLYWCQILTVQIDVYVLDIN